MPGIVHEGGDAGLACVLGGVGSKWGGGGGVCSSVMLQDRTVMSTCEHTSHVISNTCSEVIFRLQCSEVCGA